MKNISKEDRNNIFLDVVEDVAEMLEIPEWRTELILTDIENDLNSKKKDGHGKF
jgi:hypothetical protein